MLFGVCAMAGQGFDEGFSAVWGLGLWILRFRVRVNVRTDEVKVLPPTAEAAVCSKMPRETASANLFGFSDLASAASVYPHSSSSPLACRQQTSRRNCRRARWEPLTLVARVDLICFLFVQYARNS